jgi:hypothetical protein
MDALIMNFHAMGRRAWHLPVSALCYAILALMLVGFLGETAIQKALQFVR